MPQKESSPNLDEVVHGKHRRSPLPTMAREFISRRELLALVPLSMSSLDTLEKAGKFPSRFVLSPTVKVAWRRREVEKWLAERARRRVHQAEQPLIPSCRGRSRHQGASAASKR